MMKTNNIQDLNLFQQPDEFRGKPAAIVQMWWFLQWFLLRPSPQFLYGWRRFLLRLFGAKIGKQVLIRPSVQITYPWKVAIGDYSWIGDEVVLYSLGEIIIGSNSVISQRSYICTGSHNYTSPSFDIYTKPIHIGNQVWVAADVFIAPGVNIGDGAVIGVRSSVLTDLPPGMICYGNPAVPVKRRSIMVKVEG
jgi:putative colanic acid biosynthesis acetyltransferase WcaF